MTITIDKTDRRSTKALAVLATAAAWTNGHRKDDGRAFFVIPSQTGQGGPYWTDQRQSTCPDYQRRQEPCKHILAVRLWLAQHRPMRPSSRPVTRMAPQVPEDSEGGARAPMSPTSWRYCWRKCGALIPPEADPYCDACSEKLDAGSATYGRLFAADED